jgi:hypothetical protein
MTTTPPASILRKRYPEIPDAFRNAMKLTDWKEYTERGERLRIRAEVRFDDNCGNGHQTLSVTGEIQSLRKGKWHEDSCGCLHDEIAKHFPELSEAIKFHLCSTDGPMHYAANTVYHASNRDCHGLLKGEERQLRSGKTGLLCWEADKGPERFVDSETCPEPVVIHYKPRMQIGEGKERQLDHARACAIWPDATDAELMQEPDALKAVLLARLPALLEDFRRVVQSLGFTTWGKVEVTP